MVQTAPRGPRPQAALVAGAPPARSHPAAASEGRFASTPFNCALPALRSGIAPFGERCPCDVALSSSRRALSRGRSLAPRREHRPSPRRGASGGRGRAPLRAHFPSRGAPFLPPPSTSLCSRFAQPSLRSGGDLPGTSRSRHPQRPERRPPFDLTSRGSPCGRSRRAWMELARLRHALGPSPTTDHRVTDHPFLPPRSKAARCVLSGRRPSSPTVSGPQPGGDLFVELRR